MSLTRLPQVPTVAEVIDAAIGERVAAYTGIDDDASAWLIATTVAGFGFDLGLDLAHEAELAGRRLARAALTPVQQVIDVASLIVFPLDVWDQPSAIVKAGRQAKRAAVTPLLLAKVVGL